MALYQARSGERLDALLTRAYGGVTDANLNAAYFANRDLPLVFDGGESVDLPDDPQPRQYAADAVEWRYSPTPIQVAPYTDHHDGSAADITTAARWAIISRCLTPLGDVWLMPAYGSLFYTMLGRLRDDATRAAAQGVCEAAVSLDADFYEASFSIAYDGTVMRVDANGDVFEVALQ